MDFFVVVVVVLILVDFLKDVFYHWVGELVLWVQLLSLKSNDLNLIPRDLEDVKKSLQIIFWSHVHQTQ